MNRPKGAVNRSGWYPLKLDKHTWIPVRIKQGTTGYEAMSYTQSSTTLAMCQERCRLYNLRDATPIVEREVG